MQVIQKFAIELERFKGLLFVEVSRSPNMNGFLHSIKHQVPEDPWEITDEEKGKVMDEAAKLWDEYWSVDTYGKMIKYGEGDAARSWREWKRKQNERSEV